MIPPFKKLKRPEDFAKEYNRLAALVEKLTNSLISLGLYSPSTGIISRRGMSVSAGISMKVFEVQSAATGDGIYNCYEQSLDATEWEGTSGNPKFDDKDAVNVEVLNVNEYDPAAAQHDLSAGALLFAWQMLDDEGTMRWIGLHIIPWDICI